MSVIMFIKSLIKNENGEEKKISHIYCNCQTGC